MRGGWSFTIVSEMGKSRKSFIQCDRCGHEEFLASTSASEILRFPKNDPSEFDNVTNKDHRIEYIQCNECGEELDLGEIGISSY